MISDDDVNLRICLYAYLCVFACACVRVSVIKGKLNE